MSNISGVQASGAPAGLAKYRVLGKLGRGGMAEVELALCLGSIGFNKLVVIKRILPTLIEDPQFLAMFVDEARLGARLNHPNVIQINDAGVGADGYFMVMEYLEGQPLNRVLSRLGREGMPLAMHLRVLADALAGLHHVHELTDYDGASLGVVHRDVSPQNLFVTYEGTVKVLDFGIAKANSSTSKTQVGIVKGKVGYMAPEQARMEDVDRRADVFAIGVMLWEAATGTRLWAGKTDGGILKCLLAGKLPSPRSCKPDIPERLEAIILKALAHDREDRHASAAELQADIESYLDDSGDRVVSRDVGHLVADCFASERVKIRAIIDRQLASHESGAGAAVLPVIDHAIDHASGSGPERLPERPERTTRRDRERLNLPLPRAQAPAARPSAARRVAWMAGGAGMLAATLVAAIWALPDHGGRVSTADAATPVAAALASPEERDDVELSVSASPPSAMIYLDDQAITRNPFKGRFPRDGRAHFLRIEAPGFEPRVEEIALDRSRHIECVLVKREAESPASPALHEAQSRAAAPDAGPMGARTAVVGPAKVDGRIIRTDLP